MKLKSGAYFLIVIMAILLFVIVWSIRMEEFVAKLLPLVVSCIVFVLAAIELKKVITVSNGAEENIREEEEKRGEDIRTIGTRHFIIWLWVMALFLGIYLLSFVVAIPLFIVAYMKFHGVKWTTVIISAVLATTVIYGLFEVLLGIDLYKGIFLGSVL